MAKKTTLVIMAAGLGSRYGKGKIKQLDPIGPNGEIIMDYSIYDAKAAGFDKVVFIIRKDLKEAFDEMIGNRIKGVIETDYVYQETDDIPEQYKHIERKKPWGTGHAVLCCKDVVKEPFAIINADDVYGRQAFIKMHDFLVSEQAETTDKLHLAMAGFIIANTLSATGAVTRGLCTADENGKLTSIVETYEIRRENGEIIALTEKDAQTTQVIDPESHVSMNMWACPPEFFAKLDEEFDKFLAAHAEEPGVEYLLPSVIGDLIDRGEADCTLFETPDKWFGMTSAVDNALAREEVKSQIAKGTYPEKLWG